jgi:hypothetical protein
MKCPIMLLVMTQSSWVKIIDVGSSVPDLGYQLEWHSSIPRAWLVVNLWIKLLVGQVRIKPPSHVGDGVAEPMMAVAWCYCRVWRWRCRVDIGYGVMLLPSHAGDGNVESVPSMALSSWRWSWCDVIAESTSAMVWYRCWVMLAMALLSHAGDGAVQSCWRWRCRVYVGCGMMSLSRLTGYGTVESTLVMAWCRCQVVDREVIGSPRSCPCAERFI